MGTFVRPIAYPPRYRGNPPFFTETDKKGLFLCPAASRNSLGTLAGLLAHPQQ
jgi:hypothetical protein